MARVQLDIDEGANQLTLKAMLEADGHSVAESEPTVIITDDALKAIRYAQETPTLVLASATQVRAAVAAMRQGVVGYIFIPFQPGEVELMVRRAANEELRHETFEPMTLAEVEARHIRATLEYCRNNRAMAARLLGIGRNTLWRKLKAMDKD